MNLMQLIQQMLRSQEEEQRRREEMASGYRNGISDSGVTLEQIFRMKYPWLMRSYDKQKMGPPATMREMFPPMDEAKDHMWFPHPSLRGKYNGLL